MMSCALVFAAMIVFGLAERALEKKLRKIFRLGNVVGGSVEGCDGELD